MNEGESSDVLTGSGNDGAGSANSEPRLDSKTADDVGKKGSQKKWYDNRRRRYTSETGSAKNRRDGSVNKDQGARPKETNNLTFYNKKYNRRGSVGSIIQNNFGKTEDERYQGKAKDIHADKEIGEEENVEHVKDEKTSATNKQKRNSGGKTKYGNQKHGQAVSVKFDKKVQGHAAKSFKGEGGNAKVSTKPQKPIDVKNAKYHSTIEKQEDANKVENKAIGGKPLDKVNKTFSNKRQNKDEKQEFEHKKHAKETYLYAVIGGRINKQSNLKNFLLHRMGNPKALEFEVTDSCDLSKDGCENGMISLKFESYKKASAGRHLLNRNNRSTADKVKCFFDKAEAEGVQVNTALRNESKLEIAFKEIVAQATNVLGMHDGKINDVRTKLTDVTGHLSKKRGVSLSEFEKLSNEKLAYEDKLEELERQRKEFTRYVHSMKEKLHAIIKCDKFEHELKEVRKAFGVECHKLQTALPMYARREEILTVIKDNQVCVILGETGSGKSTQMVQYIYQAGLAGKYLKSHH